MIITRLIGGLGNQLFQYAVGRALAHRHGVPVKIDVSDFKTYTLHKYALDYFAHAAEAATESEIARLKGSQVTIPLLDRILPAKTPASYAKEKHYHVDPTVLELGDNVYLDGYWQSEQYFAEIADTIRDELTVKTPPTGKNEELLKEIDACEAVVLHVRRGDYVANKATLAIHGTCDINYYQRAVAYIKEQVKQPQFYIFSDDPTWAREHITFATPATFVDHNDADHGYEDLRLMSHAKHFVIANSTFSWWGAWLSRNEKKIVIAPKQWFNATDKDTSDLIPETWKRI